MGSGGLSLEHIGRVVAAHQPARISRALAPRRAAVAVVLRDGEHGPEALLMRRTEWRGDRWSGQVSFPGGREEGSDPDLVATAVRETREEVGVDLERSAELAGPLDAIRARSRGGVMPLSVWPFVFITTEAVAPRPSDEAEEVFWLPLDLASSGRLDAVYPYQLGPAQLALPCWNFQGQVVWGMTHRMLCGFLELIR
jgi:8-oxo-dGTP pyrophosphatase MutT (NUDIX family)